MVYTHKTRIKLRVDFLGSGRYNLGSIRVQRDENSVLLPVHWHESKRKIIKGIVFVYTNAKYWGR